MTSETEISKRAVEELNKARKNADGDLIVVLERNMKTHEAACQRFLEFLRDNFGVMSFKKSCEICQIHKRQLQEGVIKQKIQDLKTAIKLYEEEGI